MCKIQSWLSVSCGFFLGGWYLFVCGCCVVVRGWGQWCWGCHMWTLFVAGTRHMCAFRSSVGGLPFVTCEGCRRLIGGWCMLPMGSGEWGWLLVNGWMLVMLLFTCGGSTSGPGCHPWPMRVV